MMLVMNITLNGHCLCKKITYHYEGPTGKIVHCHCSKCRAWHGTAFRSRLVILKANFTWLSGKDTIANYQSSEKVSKCFCKHCGSNLLSHYKHSPTVLGIPIGGVSGDLGQIDQLHIFTDFKASWHTITDHWPQYKGLPEDTSIIHKLSS
jgi:hypothetical protein